ncbi:hypothetical protein AB6A40_006159 [Gnathostoma spinigerum]|uniref:Letm1 RBD domain-containing protein n=1 Tax=Gnathostoma spinigerum TaxID=75299 RepID=A0ABD6EIQ4_9BILA
MYIIPRCSRFGTMCFHGKILPFDSNIVSCRWSQRFLSSEPPAHKASTGWLKRYEDLLKRRWPKMYAVHRMVVDGCKWCYTDIKTYFILRRELSRGVRTIAEFDQNELEIFIQTSSELTKLVVILILIPLPATVYIIGIAIIFFPRLTLTRHFWTNEQRKEFWTSSMARSAALHFEPLKMFLKQKNVRIPSSFEELRKLRAPSLESLSIMHHYHLCRIHHVLPFLGTSRLRKRAAALRQLDYYLLNMKSIDEMGDQQLYLQLYLRRLQYYGMNIQEMRDELKMWVHYASDPELSVSSYLHAPALFQSGRFGTLK